MRSGSSILKGRLIRTPSWRQEAARRRLLVLCAMAGLALASGVLGSLTAPPHAPAGPQLGPFSYLSSE